MWHLGGQGAPLVPIGDELLFSEYDYCINLGGFSNISFRENHKRIAFDICPVNIVLNQLHPPYDAYGKAGKQGQIDLDLLHQLNEIEYYNQPFPKSLGKEWLDDVFMQVVNSSKISLLSKLRSIYEHIAIQISKYLKDKDKKALITGGGAHNTFLIELLKARSEANIVIPSNKVVDFKEALVFAFLGLLRVLEKTNIYSSATGAKKDSCSGLICLP
jgi:anhydro-N-acetylmuramic acid kinase